MLSLIFILLTAIVLVVGGTAISLFLRIHTSSGPRVHHTADDSYSTRVTIETDTMTRYARNGLVILLLGLLVVALIIISIINGFLH